MVRFKQQGRARVLFSLRDEVDRRRIIRSAHGFSQEAARCEGEAVCGRGGFGQTGCFFIAPFGEGDQVRLLFGDRGREQGQT